MELYESIAKLLFSKGKRLYTLVIDSSFDPKYPYKLKLKLGNDLLHWILESNSSHLVSIEKMSDKHNRCVSYTRNIKLLNRALGIEYKEDNTELNLPKCMEQLKDEFLKPEHDLYVENIVIFITSKKFNTLGDDIAFMIEKQNVQFFILFVGDEPGDTDDWKKENDIPKEVQALRLSLGIPEFIETLDRLILVCPEPKCVGKTDTSIVLETELIKNRIGVEYEVLYSEKDSKEELFKSFSTNQMVLENLNRETDYTFRVRLVQKKGDIYRKSNFSPPVFQKTLKEHPLDMIINSPELNSLVDQHRNLLKTLRLPKKFRNSSMLDTQQLNILVVGRIGAGKSTLINTIVSTMMEIFIRVCPECSSSKSFTKETWKILIGSSIVLWDIFGVSSGNYDKDMFLELLLGKIVYIKEDEKNEGVYTKKTFKSAKFCNSIHGIIFTINPSSQSSEEIKKNLELIEIAKALNIPYLVAMTQTDKILKADPSTNLFKNFEVMNSINTLASNYRSAFEKDSIIPVMGYTSENSPRSFVTEILCLTLLNTLVKKILANSGNKCVVEIVQAKTHEIIGHLIFDHLDIQLKDVKTELLNKFADDDKYRDTDLKNFRFKIESLLQCDLTEDELTIFNVIDTSNKTEEIEGRLYIDYEIPLIQVSDRNSNSITPVPKLQVYYYDNDDLLQEGKLVHTLIMKCFMEMKLDDFSDTIKANCEFLSDKKFHFISPLGNLIPDKAVTALQDVIQLNSLSEPCINVRIGSNLTSVSIVDESNLKKPLVKEVVDINETANIIYDICRSKQIEIKCIKYWIRDEEKEKAIRSGALQISNHEPLSGFEYLSLTQLGNQQEREKCIFEIAKRMPWFNSLVVVVKKE